uniref:peptidylprolyl isomerase n=1 Tax=Zosterops lateralis melanops TaxID=1220523 RepID=A0A8D2PJK2_ZOSLA
YSLPAPDQTSQHTRTTEMQIEGRARNSRESAKSLQRLANAGCPVKINELLIVGDSKILKSLLHNNGQPMWFTLGIREALKGWDRGLKDMCVGEKRKLTIPPALAYGKEGKGKIPPESTLIFNIDLLEIRNGPRSHESFQEMDLNDDWKLSKQEVKIYLKKEFEKHGAVVNDTQHDALVEDIFDKEDEDSDGFISAREFTYKHDEL